MEKISILDSIEYGLNKPAIKVLLDNAFVKEIRIAFRKGQVMKEHKSNYPITVEVVEGSIDFGVSGERHLLSRGTIIVLEASVLHDLLAVEESIVRLSQIKSKP